MLDQLAPFGFVRCHIAGEYQDGDETIQVDRVFVVSSDLYEQFDVGDVCEVNKVFQNHARVHNRRNWTQDGEEKVKMG